MEFKDNPILKQARERFEEADRAEQENRTRASEAIDYYVGNQWDKEILKKRKEAKLPCTVYNQMGTLVSRVKSNISANIPSMVVLPEEANDAVNATNIQKIVKHIERRSNADKIYKDTIGDTLNGGFGYFRILNKFSTFDTFEQEIVMERIADRFNVYTDPNARMDTFEDEQYKFVTETVKLEEFDKKYPGVVHANFFDKSTIGNQFDKWFFNHKIRLAEYFWKKPSKKKIASVIEPPSPDGSPSNELVVDLAEVSKKTLTDNGYTINEEREVDSHKVMWVKMIGTQILEGPTEIPCDFIPVIKAVGKREIVDGKQQFYSLIENVKAPQNLLNYALTTESILVGTQNKAQWLAAQDLVEGYEDVYANSFQEDVGLLTYHRNPLWPQDRPELLRPPASSQGYLNLIQHSIGMIEDVSGITDAFLGRQSNEVSGRAIAIRSQSSESVTDDFSDNIVSAIRYAGRVIINMIGKVYNKPDMIVRIIGADNAVEYLTLNPLVVEGDDIVVLNDISKSKYDYVVVAEATHKTKRRENVATLLQVNQLLQQFPLAQAVVVPKILANMDIEGSAELSQQVAAALQTSFGQQQGSPPANAGNLGESQQARAVAVAGR